jgi:hypothetical protein
MYRECEKRNKKGCCPAITGRNLRPFGRNEACTRTSDPIPDGDADAICGARIAFLLE